MGTSGRTLSIVIPALNEEEAIGGTIRRCLEARAHITAQSDVDEVEILVVSDGSTDRTEEIARSFPAVAVLAFERNRGYGAAIKCGFQHARGDLLGFLDADGTCDPRFFADLSRAVSERDADVALGSRCGDQSEMPFVRSLGNAVFAWILGLLSRRRVDDTASGMRVLRRDRLGDLYPLPDGLHFTPAMSARVLLQDKLTLVELPMPYAERIGRSKLSVARDGVRFLQAIVRAAMCYRPARPLLLVAGVFAYASALLAAAPGSLWLTSGRLEEWMIYRILLSSLSATMAALLVCAAVLADRVAATVHDRRPESRGLAALVGRLFTPRARLAGGVALVALGLLVAGPGMLQYATTGHVHMHWSRAVLAALLVVLAAVLAITTSLLHMMDLMWKERQVRLEMPPPDRIHGLTALEAPARHEA